VDIDPETFKDWCNAHGFLPIRRVERRSSTMLSLSIRRPAKERSLNSSWSLLTRRVEQAGWVTGTLLKC
jgi:hypothetical protein